MKKILSVVASVALVSSASFAMDTSKLYYGAGLALESASAFDSGFALVLNAGLPLEDIKVGPGSLAVEGEFTYSMVPPSVGSLKFSAMTLGAYAAYTYDIDSKMYVKPRAGLIYRSYTMDVPFFGSVSNSEIGIALGVGGGYKLNETMDVYADYTMLDGSDLTHLTAGVQFKF